MFFVMDSIVELPKMVFPPQSPSSLLEPLQSRVELQKFIQDAEKKAAPDCQRMAEKLVFSVDLLENCSKLGLLPDLDGFRCFLRTDEKFLKLLPSPKNVFSVDLIYSRYAFCLSVLRSCRGEIEAVRRSVEKLDLYPEVIKTLLDKLLLASVRMYKLERFQSLAFSDLGKKSRLPELNPATAKAFDQLFRLNLGSVLILKALSQPMKPEKAVFLVQLCKKCKLMAEEQRAFFGKLDAPEMKNLAQFCEIAEDFYYFLTLFMVIRCNLYENDSLLDRTKDFKVSIYQNFACAQEIKRILKKIADSPSKITHFNTTANKAIFESFYQKFMSEFVEECIGNYKAMKDDCVGVVQSPPGHIFDAVLMTNDFLEHLLSTQP